MSPSESEATVKSRVRVGKVTGTEPGKILTYECVVSDKGTHGLVLTLNSKSNTKGWDPGFSLLSLGKL